MSSLSIWSWGKRWRYVIPFRSSVNRSIREEFWFKRNLLLFDNCYYDRHSDRPGKNVSAKMCLMWVWSNFRRLISTTKLRLFSIWSDTNDFLPVIIIFSRSRAGVTSFLSVLIPVNVWWNKLPLFGLTANMMIYHYPNSSSPLSSLNCQFAVWGKPI